LNIPKHHHSDRDEIFTPEDISQKLIEKIPYDDEDIWCDPCYGQGTFYNNFPCGDSNKDFFEINMNKDFLKSNDKWDWVVTNIPFSKPKEFIFKMAESCEKGFGILCLANSMTATRLKKLKDMGLYLHSMEVIYIREWGFGYRTDFYVFTRDPVKNIGVMIT
jgi:hypothetical protein